MPWNAITHYETIVTQFTDQKNWWVIAYCRVKINVLLDDDSTFTTFTTDFERHLDITKLTLKHRNREKNMLEKHFWDSLTDDEDSRLLRAILNRVRTYWLWIPVSWRKLRSPQGAHWRKDIHLYWSDLENYNLDMSYDFDE